MVSFIGFTIQITIFTILISIVISAIIGLFWVSCCIIISKSIQTTIIIYRYSFSGGLIGGIAGSVIGYLVGETAENGSILIGPPLALIYWFFSCWIAGIIVGAITGGLIGVDAID